MRASLLKLKRLIKRLFQIKEEVDMTAGRRRSRVLVKYLMGIAAVGMISLLYPLREMYGPLDIPREGEIAAQTIVAEFPFSMPKSRANLEEERRLAILSTPLSMDYDDDIVENNRTQVRRLFTKVRSLRRERPALTAQQMARRVGEEFPSLPEPWITRLAQVDSLTALQATLDSVLFEDIYYFGIVADSASLPPQYGSVIVRTKKRDLLMMRNQMVDVQGAYGRLLEALNRTPNLGDADIEVGYQIGRNFLVPNATFDAAATQASRDSALAAIVTTDARVAEGDLLVRGGTRVDAAQARALAAYAQEFRKKAASKGLLTASLPIVGRVVLVAAIVFLLYLIFYRFRPDVYWSNNRLFAVLLIIGMSLYLVNFVAVRLVSSVYLYPIAILSILLTVLYDARLGVVVTLLIAILLGVLNRFNFTITLITAIAGTVACFSAGEVRRRSEFYRIILSLSFSYVIIAFVVESLKLSPTGDVLT
jgi:membrane-associated HD superfamily phosphohydrolase